MKLVIAVIHPSKLQAVQQALAAMGVPRMTVCDGQSYATTEHPFLYFGAAADPNIIRRAILQIVVNDDFLEKTINVIQRLAKTQYFNHTDDGQIQILPVQQVIQLAPPVVGPGAV